MKKILFVAMLLAAAFSAVADDKLCNSNIELVDNYLKTAQHDKNTVKMIQDYRDKAAKARDAGNMEECVNQSTQAKRVMRKAEKH